MIQHVTLATGHDRAAVVRLRIIDGTSDVTFQSGTTFDPADVDGLSFNRATDVMQDDAVRCPAVPIACRTFHIKV